MPNTQLFYQSKESIFGRHPRSKEWIEYRLIIKIRSSGKQPVSIDMTFRPPHPFVMNMPDKHLIKAETLSQAFTKIVKYFRRFGFEISS